MSGNGQTASSVSSTVLTSQNLASTTIANPSTNSTTTISSVSSTKVHSFSLRLSYFLGLFE